VFFSSPFYGTLLTRPLPLLSRRVSDKENSSPLLPPYLPFSFVRCDQCPELCPTTTPRPTPPIDKAIVFESIMPSVSPFVFKIMISSPAIPQPPNESHILAVRSLLFFFPLTPFLFWPFPRTVNRDRSFFFSSRLHRKPLLFSRVTVLFTPLTKVGPTPFSPPPFEGRTLRIASLRVQLHLIVVVTPPPLSLLLIPADYYHIVYM